MRLKQFLNIINLYFIITIIYFLSEKVLMDNDRLLKNKRNFEPIMSKKDTECKKL